MNIHQISVFLENRAGQLAEITKVLSENNIDLRAISIAETSDYGVLFLLQFESAEAHQCNCVALFQCSCDSVNKCIIIDFSLSS